MYERGVYLDGNILFYPLPQLLPFVRGAPAQRVGGISQLITLSHMVDISFRQQQHEYFLHFLIVQVLFVQNDVAYIFLLDLYLESR